MELIVSYRDEYKVHTVSVDTKKVPRNSKELNRLEDRIKRLSNSNIVKILDYSLGNPEIRLDKIIRRTGRKLRGVINE